MNGRAGEQLLTVALCRQEMKADDRAHDNDEEEDDAGRNKASLGEGVGQRESAGADACSEKSEDGGADGALGEFLPGGLQLAQLTGARERLAQTNGFGLHGYGAADGSTVGRAGFHSTRTR